MKLVLIFADVGTECPRMTTNKYDVFTNGQPINSMTYSWHVLVSIRVGDIPGLNKFCRNFLTKLAGFLIDYLRTRMFCYRRKTFLLNITSVDPFVSPTIRILYDLSLSSDNCEQRNNQLLSRTNQHPVSSTTRCRSTTPICCR